MDNKQMERMAREHDMTAMDAELAGQVAEAVAEGTVSGYKKIEVGIVGIVLVMLAYPLYNRVLRMCGRRLPRSSAAVRRIAEIRLPFITDGKPPSETRGLAPILKFLLTI